MTSTEPAPNATPLIRPSAIPKLRGSSDCTITTPGAFCTRQQDTAEQKQEADRRRGGAIEESEQARHRGNEGDDRCGNRTKAVAEVAAQVHADDADQQEVP